MYPSELLIWSMASNGDGFRTVVCQTQNLSLIKFHYTGIKIIILQFSYFIKPKHIEVHTELLNFFVSDMIQNNGRFVPLIYHAPVFGFLSFHYLAFKTIMFTFYWYVNHDQSWSPYRNNNIFILIMTEINGHLGSAICHPENWRFLKSHHLVIKKITSPSIWYIKTNHTWSP